MRAVIQRTLKKATVEVEKKIVGEIDKGLVVYLGVEQEDTIQDIIWLANKIKAMRIFSDQEGKMNLSLDDIGGSILLISQFTLFASTKKGNRPSFLRSAKPDLANLMYEQTINYMTKDLGINVSTGVFGADMKVEYTNDGPVTIIIDSKNKE